MMLFLSLALGVLPLLGIGWTVANGNITTVDGLFMSLILLALSGILLLNAYLEFRNMTSSKKAPRAQKTS